MLLLYKYTVSLKINYHTIYLLGEAENTGTGKHPTSRGHQQTGGSSVVYQPEVQTGSPGT